MKILEHTSTRLTLKDSSVTAYLTRLISSIFLIWGCLCLVVLFKDIVVGIFNGDILPNLRGLAFIAFFIFVGSIGIFWSSTNTVCFDKEQRKLIIKIERVLITKVTECSLNDFTNVMVEKKKASKYMVYFVTLKIASIPRRIRLSQTSFMRFEKAKELELLIRDFLK